MIPSLRHLLALAAFAVPLPFSVAAPLPDEPVYGHLASDLRADPKVKFGQLANGLRYAILPNNEPRDRISLRLLVMAGSLQETDEQQGLAHFLEHMAFNGSKNYPAGTLIEFFQRMGMSFGGDTNAHTSFDHTAYLIELPHRDPKTTAEGLRVLADFAGGLTLDDREIDKERGIILAEKRDRDSVGLREWMAEAAFTLQGTRIPQRLPIGLQQVIEQAPRDRFTSFYDAWYRPEHLAVIAVGDFDVATLEAQITEAFSALTARGPKPEKVDLGEVAPLDRPRAFAHHEPESGATRVSIQVIRNEPRTADTAASRRESLLEQLAASIVNRRLEILGRKTDALFTYGSLSIDQAFHHVHSASIELSCKPEQWRATLAIAENELRRALQYGFSASELDEAKAVVRNGLEEAARTAPTRRSEALADALMNALIAGDVFTTPADELALLLPALEAATPAACHEALQKAFSGRAPVITVIGNAKVADSPEAAEAAILKVISEASSVAVSAPSDEKAPPFAYTYFGDPGSVALSRHVPDLDVHLATLSNGVRLNLKKTDFEKGRVRIFARVGGGLLTQPLDQPGLPFLFQYAFFSGGLGKHSIDDLQRILAGKTVSLQMRAGTDAFIFTGETNETDLLLNLQLLAAYLTDPGYRPEALTQLQKQLDQFYTRIEHVPEGPLQMDIPRFLAQGDTRFGMPRRREASARTFEELKAWVGPELAHGAIEITLVGDLNLDNARTAITQTLGALPKRAAKPAYTTERAASFPAPTSRSFVYVSELPKAYVYVTWPTTDARDITLTRQMNLLANVFEDRLRMRVREELGDAYSPGAMSTPSDAFTGYGSFSAIIAASPDKTEKLTAVTLEIARDLIEKGITADELERAKQPVLTSIREAARTNPYWLQTVLSSAQEMPQRLDWRRTIESGHAAITPEQLHAVAKRFLSPERAFRFASIPGQTASPEPSPAPLVKRPRPTPLTAQPATSTPSGPRVTPTPTAPPPNDF